MTKMMTFNLYEPFEIDSLDIIKKISNIIEVINKEDIVFQGLKGDASDRSYIKCYSKNKTNKKSLIVMKLSEPFKESSELPFINIQKYLLKQKISVPILYHYFKDKGLILLQDLGNITFETLVKSDKKNDPTPYYKHSIDILINMQLLKNTGYKNQCVAFNNSFDLNVFMKELEMFLEFAIEDLFNKKISKKKDILNCFLKLCTILTKQEYCFTHRDFHSRNIMVKENILHIIDFQDARMGPYQYDIASLLRDSYVQLDENIFEKLLSYYIDKLETVKKKKIDRSDFRKILDYMIIQRSLKAVGTFAFQKVKKKNYRYLKYIPVALNYAKQTLCKYPELKKLNDLIQQF